MAIPISSGFEWEEDPAGNANSHDGRTVRRDMRAKSEPSTRAIVKRPAAGQAAEIYSIGMERVAHSLATLLDLPVPATYLEEIDGFPSSVQLRIANERSWRQADGAPMMKQNVVNASIYAKSALFDVWIANTDRRDVNMLLEPQPAGTPPGRATACRLWLIDHGCSGLWPAGKLEQGRGPNDIPDSDENITGELCDAGEAAIGFAMVPEYRMALKNAQGPDRESLLDAVDSVRDDAIASAIAEVPDAYMSSGQREATVALLIGRRNKLSTVLKDYW